MAEPDYFYIRRFKATLIAILVLVLWWNWQHVLRLPGLALDLLCYLCCRRQRRQPGRKVVRDRS